MNEKRKKVLFVVGGLAVYRSLGIVFISYLL